MFVCVVPVDGGPVRNTATFGPYEIAVLMLMEAHDARISWLQAEEGAVSATVGGDCNDKIRHHTFSDTHPKPLVP